MELEEAMDSIMPSREYRDALQDLLVNYAGRETPLTFCPHLSEKLGFRLWLKREDLLHTGAHKINNALGQALLAKMMGKTHLIAETGAGQHGVATATAAARQNGLHHLYGRRGCRTPVHERYAHEIAGSDGFPIESGSRTLKDAINEALRYWISHQADTLYCFGTAAGPIRSPHWSGSFNPSLGGRPAPRCWSVQAGCRMWWWHAWAAAPMPSACFTPLWRMKASVW